MATIEERYASKFAKSAEWFQRGMSVFAGGVQNPSRFASPFPLFIERAEGPYKWDVDGNQIIDYLMGSGSLIMGHSPKEVADAIATQTRQGTLFTGASTHEVRYAEAVKRLMPNIERVKFTNSGTESTYMAVRLAREYTGKNKIVKLREHFHGWHDHVTPESGMTLGGIPRSVLDNTIVAPVDTRAIDRILSENDDIAGVILESNGAHYGTFPLPNPQFLEDIRDITARHGVVFILDEVISGFRLSPGGAQMRWNIEPDLTTMAKVMGGGQPGAAVGGRAEIMDLLTSTGNPERDLHHQVSVSGTYSANPITAAAGIATLEAVATKGINARADALARRLKDSLNGAFIRNEVTGHAHGIASIVHVNLGADCDCDREICTMTYQDIYRTNETGKAIALKQAMLVNGVDPMGAMGGRCFMVSSAHSEDLIDQTVEAFSQSLRDLRAEGIV